jgi:3-oxoadipate enol-lactonase
VRDGRRRARVAITPAARGLAQRMGIDVATLQGSGPGGRVLREDVEAAAERRKGLLEVAKGVALEVRVQGDGEPLVLLPGFGCDVSIFAQQTAMLLERHRVLAVNPRGIGLSDAPEASAYEVTTLASDAAALIEAPTHVVGASHGAAVALELALRWPEKVRSLVLITPFLEVTPRLLAVLDAWCRVASAGGDALAAMLLPWLFSDDLLGDDARLRVVRRGLADTAGRVSTATLERTAAGLRSWSGTRSEDIAKLVAPTLVVAGAADLLVPEAADLARRIPPAHCESVPRCGHAVSIEAPEALNAALARHLAVRA